MRREGLVEMVTPVTNSLAHDQEKTLERESVCACEGFKGDECFIGLDRSVIENHRNDSLGHSREE